MYSIYTCETQTFDNYLYIFLSLRKIEMYSLKTENLFFFLYINTFTQVPNANDNIFFNVPKNNLGKSGCDETFTYNFFAKLSHLSPWHEKVFSNMASISQRFSNWKLKFLTLRCHGHRGVKKFGSDSNFLKLYFLIPYLQCSPFYFLLFYWLPVLLNHEKER